MCYCTFETRGDEAFVGIDGEVDECAFLKGERGFAVITVAILLDGVPKCLTGKSVLQFGGGDGETVETEQEVYGLLVLGAEMDLTGDGEAIRLIELRDFGVEAAGGGAVSQMEGLPEEIEAVAEDVERTARVKREG